MTEHPVHVIIKNIQPGYGVSVADRTAFVRFVKQLVKKNLVKLNDALELVDILYAGKIEGYEYQTSSIPLKVVVEGPSGAGDKTYDYVTQIIDEYYFELEDFLASLNQEAYLQFPPLRQLLS